MNKIISTLATLLAACSIAFAQQKTSITAGTDIVSSYVWRGSYNAGASVQPKLEIQLAGFTVGAWGSVDIVGQQHKEADLSLAYSLSGLTIGVTDYWWEGEGALKYFDYRKASTAHRWEGYVAYRLPVEKIPLRLACYTLFAGNDYKSDGERAYSTYVELDYPFAIGSIDMNATIGAVPWISPSFLPSNNKGFSVCNVTVGATRAIPLSQNISMPIFTKLIFNPATEDIHLIFGLSLYFGN